MTDLPPKPPPGVYPPPPDSASPPPPPQRVSPREQLRERRTLILLAVGAAILIALYLMLFAAEDARGQGVVCRPHDEITQGLKRKYGEIPIFVAINDQSQLVEVFASAGRSWSYVITSADGMACIADNGQGIDAVRPPPDEDV